MREVFAVWYFQRGWVVDTCAGGTYSGEECDAMTWPSADEARAEMKAGDFGDEGADWEVEKIVEPWKQN